MNIEEDLKKDGIIVIRPVDTLSVMLISKFVSEKFISFFPFYRLNYNDLFVKISKVPMYIVEVTEGMSEANYFYKNSSIYFKDGLTLEEMQKLAIHEFIHYFQEVKDNKGILYRLGLCDFTGMKIHGMALNEAAVQLLSSKILNLGTDTVKYYGINFSTTSPNYYPLLCNLVNQISYLIGEDILFDSTVNSNNKFYNIFCNLLGKKTFNKVQNNLDNIMDAEEKIVKITAILRNMDNLSEKNISKYSMQIANFKKYINETFIKTQNLLLTSYFNNELDKLYSVEEIESFRQKLYCYKDLIGVTDGYNFFNIYYIDMMGKLEAKYEEITGISTSLVTYKRSIIDILFSKIKGFFGLKNAETINIK